MQQIVDFILELEKLKGVTRKVRPLGLKRYENSAEHSWSLALLAVALAEYASEPINLDQVIRMLLVHDVGEIETGDTMAFVEGGWQERKAGELACVSRIFGMLPADGGAELIELWKEFEAGETSESMFANAVDRAMPVLQNLNNNGQSWRENGITYDRVVKRVRGQIEAGCPALWKYLEVELEKAREKGIFGGV